MEPKPRLGSLQPLRKPSTPGSGDQGAEMRVRNARSADGSASDLVRRPACEARHHQGIPRLIEGPGAPVIRPVHSAKGQEYRDSETVALCGDGHNAHFRAGGGGPAVTPRFRKGVHLATILDKRCGGFRVLQGASLRQAKETPQAVLSPGSRPVCCCGSRLVPAFCCRSKGSPGAPGALYNYLLELNHGRDYRHGRPSPRQCFHRISPSRPRLAPEHLGKLSSLSQMQSKMLAPVVNGKLAGAP